MLFDSTFVVTVFLAEQFKGKIPVPPIQELFELEPNVLSKRWDKILLILSLQSWGGLIKAFLHTNIGYDSGMKRMVYLTQFVAGV